MLNNNYISSNPLEEIVLRNLREAIADVSQYENDFGIAIEQSQDGTKAAKADMA